MSYVGWVSGNPPLPNPPPQAGEGTIALSPASRRELERRLE